MTSEKPVCQACQRTVMQTVTNRCMYCGADLPAEHHLSAEEKNLLLNEKMEQFRRNEENADELVNSLRESYGLRGGAPKKKTRKEKRAEKSQAVNEALADIQQHLEKAGQQNKPDS